MFAQINRWPNVWFVWFLFFFKKCIKLNLLSKNFFSDRIYFNIIKMHMCFHLLSHTKYFFLMEFHFGHTHIKYAEQTGLAKRKYWNCMYDNKFHSSLFLLLLLPHILRVWLQIELKNKKKTFPKKKRNDFAHWISSDLTFSNRKYVFFSI